MSPPDVTLVSPYPPPGLRHAGHSGVASYTANLAHALSDAGADVCVVAPTAPDAPDRHRDGAVRVERAFSPGRAGALPKALAAARATGAPVVHVQHELFLYGGPQTVPGLLALRRGRATPTVVTMHQVVDPSHVTPQFARMHRIGVPAPVARAALAGVQQSIATLADAVVVHEKSFTRVVRRARAIPHGLEDVAPATPADRAAARDRLGWEQGVFTALCFGFLAPYKGLELAGEAAALTRRTRLVVAGGEHPRLAEANDPYAATLRGRFGGHVTFTGYVPDDRVAATFRAADVVLLPYPSPHAASGPLALALAHGIPVLMSPAMARTAGVGAELVMPTQPDALAECLDLLAGEPAALARLARAGRHVAAGRAWPAVARSHLEIYREVTDARRASRRSVRPAQRR